MPEKLKILIIENQPMSSFLLGPILKDEEFNINIARNNPDVYFLLEKEKYKLIILNLLKTGIKKLELIEKVKKNQSTCLIPIIVISNESEREVIKLCLDKGVYDYIIKPVSKQAIKNKIQFAVNDQLI